ncbi:RNA-binding KH domain-containing protein [Heracleum sosnowskyi]|uniref:RNA-binding KH domain-containing protein n=1 Tax=Heracleum sosnowskyi TaxID=360622 RepID=A0AAD8MKL3_9APIA|nr:RNA-binding KH domain-containing protein [Heracleum sosnowskyi]
MVEKGKRSHSRSERYYDGDSRNPKRRVNDRDEKVYNDELVVYRILCPDKVIGSVIGKSGKVINTIRQDSRAKVKVVDPFPGAKDRVLTVYCYVKEKVDVEVDEEFDDKEPLCAAQEALLMVHTVISKAVASLGDSYKRDSDKEECQILVPASQSANIIGKSGSTIKKLRGKTRTNIRVTSKDASDPTHSCAMHFDNFIQITGESEAVKKALFAISAIMYKFGPKEDISLDTAVPDVPPSIIIPSDVPVYPAAGLYPGHTWPVYSSSVPVVSGYGGASRSEELIIKVLCSSSKIGRVIGKGGASIKSVRQTSGARVDVDDKKTDNNDCTITITSTEKLDDMKSMAVEAVLLLQEKINDEEDETISIRLLIPCKVIGCIIGKSGSIINEIRKRTKADVRISKGDKPKRADDSSELVEVVGEVGSVRDALVQIVLRLRDDVLRDREGNRNPSDGVGLGSLYPGSASHSMPQVLPGIPPVSHTGYEQQRGDGGSGLNMLSSDSYYGYGSLPMGDSGYGSLSSPYSSKLYGGLPPPTDLEMVVPAHAVGKVMGKGGANIDNIRKISGADVEISHSKSSRGDRVALISGTPEQKRAAENLIQAFIMST